ncbi:hypothetical protein [Planktotalea sp.]|uniref:hypothetical protein n=1 Tax=Planktotalea sp. TaxID=2029877 RepID=UPI003D6C3321
MLNEFRDWGPYEVFKSAHEKAKRRLSEQPKRPVKVDPAWPTKPDLFPPPDTPTIGWVRNDYINAYATWEAGTDDARILTVLPRATKLKVVGFHKSSGWARVHLLADDDDPAPGSFFVRYTDVYWYAKGEAGYTMGADDENAILYTVKEDQTLLGIMKEHHWGDLMMDDNMFLAKDDREYRAPRLATLIMRTNSNTGAFRESDDPETLQAKTTLKLYSTIYLRSHSDLFLHIVKPVEFSDDWKDLLNQYVDVVALSVQNFSGLREALAGVGILAGLLHGAFAMLRGTITGIADDFKTTAEVIYGVFSALLSQSLDELKSFLEKLESLLSLEAIAGLMKEVWEAIKGFADLLWHDFVTAFTHPNLGQDAFAVGVAIGYAIALLVTTFATGGQALVIRILGRVGAKVLRLIFDLVEAIAAAANALSLASDVEMKARDFLKSLETKGREFLEDIQDSGLLTERHLSPIPLVSGSAKTVAAKVGVRKYGEAEGLKTDGVLKRKGREAPVHKVLRATLDKDEHLRGYYTVKIDKNEGFYVLERPKKSPIDLDAFEKMDLEEQLKHAKLVSVSASLVDIFRGSKRIDGSKRKEFREENDMKRGYDAGHPIAYKYLPDKSLVNTLFKQLAEQNRNLGRRGATDTWKWIEDNVLDSKLNKIKALGDRRRSVGYKLVPVRNSDGLVESLKFTLWEVAENSEFRKVVECDIPNTPGKGVSKKALDDMEAWANLPVR